MYYMYVDESGNPKIKPGSTDERYYVLSGVVVHEKDWRCVERGVTDVKKKMFPKLDPQSWELHASEIWQKNNHAKYVGFNIDFEEKTEIFSRVLEFISGSGITLICVVIDKHKLADKRQTSEVLGYSWKFLVERFERFLRQRPPDTNHGMLFSDSNQKATESRVRHIIIDLMKRGDRFPSIDHLIEHPIFVKSSTRNMIQIADMVSYVVHRHCKNHPPFNDWFSMIESNLYRHKGVADGFGIKRFP